LTLRLQGRELKALGTTLLRELFLGVVFLVGHTQRPVQILEWAESLVLPPLR
jgi:hypothetical protein